jgi:hypothetical protein
MEVSASCPGRFIPRETIPFTQRIISFPLTSISKAVNYWMDSQGFYPKQEQICSLGHPVQTDSEAHSGTVSLSPGGNAA